MSVTVRITTATAVVEKTTAQGFGEADRIATAIGEVVAAFEALGAGRGLRQLVIHELGGRLPPPAMPQQAKPHAEAPRRREAG